MLNTSEIVQKLSIPILFYGWMYDPVVIRTRSVLLPQDVHKYLIWDHQRYGYKLNLFRVVDYVQTLTKEQKFEFCIKSKPVPDKWGEEVLKICFGDNLLLQNKFRRKWEFDSQQVSL